MLTIRKMAARSLANKGDIKNSKADSTVYLYEDIGGWFGIDHKEWIKDLNAIDSDTIHLRIDSSGGDIFAARAMKTAIMQHKAKVIAHIDGLAASAASFLAMGADEIEIVDGGFFMIHKALSFIDILGYFNEEDLNGLVSDMQKESGLHEKINDSIASDYSKRTGKDKSEFLSMMADETWLTAQEAVDIGLADRIYDGNPVDNSHDLSIFAKVPDALKGRKSSTSKRLAEKALRDAGISREEAKAILAKGFDEGRRDADRVDEPKPVVVALRDADKPKKDRVSELLTKAELIAPSENAI